MVWEAPRVFPAARLLLRNQPVCQAVLGLHGGGDCLPEPPVAAAGCRHPARVGDEELAQPGKEAPGAQARGLGVPSVRRQCLRVQDRLLQVWGPEALAGAAGGAAGVPAAVPRPGAKAAGGPAARAASGDARAPLRAGAGSGERPRRRAPGEPRAGGPARLGRLLPHALRVPGATGHDPARRAGGSAGSEAGDREREPLRGGRRLELQAG